MIRAGKLAMGLVALVVLHSCSWGVLFFAPVENRLVDPTYVGKYKLGDLGPAGGLVFFDLGFLKDGWQYLEAAPADLALKMYNNSVDSTKTGVGAGKENTRLLVEATTADNAAVKCDGLTQEGFSDWFLPSRDELGALYYGLASQGMGNFKRSGDLYWSSSSAVIDSMVYAQNFGSGSVGEWSASQQQFYVRAIRSF